MNVLMVHLQSRASDVVITCEPCVTAWRVPREALGGGLLAEMIDHVCDPDRADVTPVAYDHQRGSTTGHDG